MKQIKLNAFAMSSVTHSHQGLWRHPRDRSLEYADLSYWIEFAQLLERGLFDGLFMADGSSIYDVYGGDYSTAVERAVMVPKNDPSLLVSAMAAATEHLGFGITFNVTEELPYFLARKISTLDHLTKGRMGWNIVTGFLDSAAKARGATKLMEHDERYDLAEEFLEVVYRLWEESWAEGAVLRDTQNGIYADPELVKRIKHAGKFFNLDAVHICEPSPQRTPVLYQAGTSSRGVEFAGRHAECVFVNGATPEKVGERVRKIREAVAQTGRDPQSVRIFASMNVVPAATDAEARDKLEEYTSYIDGVGSLVRLSGFIGKDLSVLKPDDPIVSVKSNAIQSILENLTSGGGTKVRDALNSLNPKGVQPVVAGGPATVADALQNWVEQADVDGFNLTQTVKSEGMADFIDLVVPELQSRGVYKTEYQEGTLREKLMGAGAYTAPEHPSAKARAAA